MFHTENCQPPAASIHTRVGLGQASPYHESKSVLQLREIFIICELMTALDSCLFVYAVNLSYDF